MKYLFVVLAAVLLAASPVAAAGPTPEAEELHTSTTPIERETVVNEEKTLYAEVEGAQGSSPVPATGLFSQTSTFIYLLLALSILAIIGFYAFKR